MALARFQELMRQQVSAGMRGLKDIPLVSRAEISKAAGEAFDEALSAARGREINTPQVRTLQLVSKVINGKWDDAE